MGFNVGIVGKPSCGKTSFTNAACMTDFKVGSYPFTTIEANVGVAHVRSQCVCEEFDVTDNPQNSVCIDGIRLIPIKLIDVAGLVPGAHEGRGMGNQFLDDLRQADVLIHIVDASGALDSEGQEVSAGSYDPVEDVKFLEEEITQWIFNIIQKDWRRMSGRIRAEGAKLEDLLLEKLSGLNISRVHILKAIRDSGFKSEGADQWTDDDLKHFTHGHFFQGHKIQFDFYGSGPVVIFSLDGQELPVDPKSDISALPWMVPGQAAGFKIGKACSTPKRPAGQGKAQ